MDELEELKDYAKSQIDKLKEETISKDEIRRIYNRIIKYAEDNYIIWYYTGEGRW